MGGIGQMEARWHEKGRGVPAGRWGAGIKVGGRICWRNPCTSTVGSDPKLNREQRRGKTNIPPRLTHQVSPHQTLLTQPWHFSVPYRRSMIQEYGVSVESHVILYVWEYELSKLSYIPLPMTPLPIARIVPNPGKKI